MTNSNGIHKTQEKIYTKFTLGTTTFYTYINLNEAQINPGVDMTLTDKLIEIMSNGPFYIMFLSGNLENINTDSHKGYKFHLSTDKKVGVLINTDHGDKSVEYVTTTSYENDNDVYNIIEFETKNKQRYYVCVLDGVNSEEDFKRVAGYVKSAHPNGESTTRLNYIHGSGDLYKKISNESFLPLTDAKAHATKFYYRTVNEVVKKNEKQQKNGEKRKSQKSKEGQQQQPVGEEEGQQQPAGEEEKGQQQPAGEEEKGQQQPVGEGPMFPEWIEWGGGKKRTKVTRKRYKNTRKTSKAKKIKRKNKSSKGKRSKTSRRRR